MTGLTPALPRRTPVRAVAPVRDLHRLAQAMFSVRSDGVQAADRLKVPVRRRALLSSRLHLAHTHLSLIPSLYLPAADTHTRTPAQVGGCFRRTRTRGKRPGRGELTRLRRAGLDPTLPGHVGFGEG